MTDERKASDVILELEQKLDSVLGFVRSIDTNVKLLLNAKNVQGVAQPQTVPTAAAPTASAPTASVPTAEPVEAVDFPQVSEPHGKPRTVQEKLYYAADSKVILLAQVEIFDQNGKLLNKTRTNNQGAWTARLAPGTYKIRVAKSATSTKPQVLQTYNIVVTSGDGPLPLESRKL